MAKPTWEVFFGVLAGVIVFVVPIVLYLMEKANKKITWIFIVGLLFLGIAALYLVLNIPWVWSASSTAWKVYRASMVSSFALLAVGYFGIWVWPSTPASTQQRPSTSTQAPPTLRDLFNKDFPNAMKAADEAIGIEWKDGGVMHIKRQLYLDFPAKTKFVGFYVPSSDPLSPTKSLEACMRLAEAVQQALEDIPKKVAISGGYRGEMTGIQDLTFSGRVVIYHEAFLSIPQKAAIINTYAAKHFDVQFRGPDYLGDQIIAWHHQHDTKQSH
jgi:hypothetical protein